MMGWFRRLFVGPNKTDEIAEEQKRLDRALRAYEQAEGQSAAYAQQNVDRTKKLINAAEEATKLARGG